MNENFEVSQEFQSLLSELMDGTLTETRRQKLGELLRDNPSAQDAYRNFMAVHALLHLDFGGGELPLLPPVVRSFPSLVPLRCDATADTPEKSVVKGSRHNATRHRRRLPTWAAYVALAAAVMIVVWGLSWSYLADVRAKRPFSTTIGSDTRRENAAKRAFKDEYSKSEIEAVAILGQASNAVWSDAKLPLDIGSTLPSGEFHLTEGLVQIDFFSGANVIIQAPADV